MDMKEQVKCARPECGKSYAREKMKGSIGGSMLCESCWPMHSTEYFPTDPKVDHTAYCKCKRAGCKERFPIREQKLGRMYCSQDCQLADIDPRAVNLYGNARL